MHQNPFEPGPVGTGIAPFAPSVPADRRALRHLVDVPVRDAPLWPLPEWPEISDETLRKVFVPPNTWHAAASRHVENFNDVAHFPWVHKSTFGGSIEDRFPAYNVQETAYGLTFDLAYEEGGNRFPDDVPGDSRHVVYTYELTYPFSTIIIIRPS